jgi:hypothetical protein
LAHHRIDDRIYHLVRTVEGVDRDVWKLSIQRSLHHIPQDDGAGDGHPLALREGVTVLFDEPPDDGRCW